MSLLTPAISNAATVQPRDPSALVVAAAQRAAPAVSSTLTQMAVQQAKAGTRTELLSTRDLLPVTDKKNRLVGPPPTFEVNLLQHIRETRNDPPEVVASDDLHGSEASEAAHTTSDTVDRQSPVKTTYGLLQQADTPKNSATTVNARF
jgi:hypothetical protein